MIGVNAQYESGRLIVLQQFLLDNGEQIGRLHGYLKDALLPALAREVGGAQIVLEAIVAAHQPQVLFLQEYEDVAQWRAASLRLKQDAALLAAHAAWDKAGPYLSHATSLLAATHYSSPIAPSETPRIFELRLYQAPSEWQFNGLHERFAGPEVPIFHRCGIFPLFYASTIAGPQMPNLTYLTPFASLAVREEAWAKFQADPEWHAARQHSIDQHGYTPRALSVSLYKSAPYSPIR